MGPLVSRVHICPGMGRTHTAPFTAKKGRSWCIIVRPSIVFPASTASHRCSRAYCILAQAPTPQGQPPISQGGLSVLRPINVHIVDGCSRYFVFVVHSFWMLLGPCTTMQREEGRGREEARGERGNDLSRTFQNVAPVRMGAVHYSGNKDSGTGLRRACLLRSPTHHPSTPASLDLDIPCECPNTLGHTSSAIFFATLIPDDFFPYHRPARPGSDSRQHGHSSTGEVGL